MMPLTLSSTVMKTVAAYQCSHHAEVAGGFTEWCVERAIHMKWNVMNFMTEDEYVGYIYENIEFISEPVEGVPSTHLHFLNTPWLPVARSSEVSRNLQPPPPEDKVVDAQSSTVEPWQTIHTPRSTILCRDLCTVAVPACSPCKRSCLRARASRHRGIG